MPDLMNPSPALDFLRRERDRHVRELQDFLAIPSISALSDHGDDVRRAAKWLGYRLDAAGFASVTVDETSGHPLVMARTPHNPERPTILVYGHYDVQPVDPLEQWHHPPFQPTINDGRLYARGASDDKGQVFMQLIAAESWLKTGQDLPVNLIFMIEGEEEIGSVHLPPYIRQHANNLSADVAVISDTPMYAAETPAICYGLRGLAALEVTVSGPFQDLHSGVYGGTVKNPAHALAELIASLHTPDGKVSVDGFYRDVDPISPEERQAFRDLPFDADAYREDIQVPALFGEPGYSPLERIWARPTIDVNGMWSGFIGEGQKTIIPATAHAKMTCRLVPRQNPDFILDRVEDHLKSHCPPGVRLTVRRGKGDPGIVTPLDHPVIQAAQKALEEVYRRRPVFIRMGGSIPVVTTFQEVLHMPSILLGFALPNENFHAPNEHFHLDNFYRGSETLARLWGLLSQWHRHSGEE